MNREQFIQNDLGIKIANMTIEAANIKAELNEMHQKNQELQAKIDELTKEEG